MATTVDWIPLLKALADPTRLELVRLLLDKDHTVEQLASALNATEYNISKHLRILREAGVVLSNKKGRHLHNSITPAFRKKMGDHRVLDLGCCSFQFDREKNYPVRE